MRHRIVQLRWLRCSPEPFMCLRRHSDGGRIRVRQSWVSPVLTQENAPPLVRAAMRQADVVAIVLGPTVVGTRNENGREMTDVACIPPVMIRSNGEMIW